MEMLFCLFVSSSFISDLESCYHYTTTQAYPLQSLVDLAVSRRIAKTCTRGGRLKEGKNINSSLMILAMRSQTQ